MKNNYIRMNKYKFVPYQEMAQKDLLRILESRNNPLIAQWMRNTKLITVQEHLAFVDSLKSNESKYYYGAYRHDQLVGAVYITVDRPKGEWGFFLINDYLNSGIGVELQFYAHHLFFDELKLDLLVGLAKKENLNSIRIQLLFGYKIIDNQDPQFIELRLHRRQWEQYPKNFTDFRKKTYQFSQ